jgi:putative SOS response-associated peptidase YedK
MRETVISKPAFRDAFRQRRCLVPADFFYEWKTTPAGKQPYAVGIADATPMAFAGLWERWRDPIAGDVLHSFTIITGPPNELVSPIHNRMPIILPPEAWGLWLGEARADIEQLVGLLRPYPADLMRAYPVGKRVGSVRNNDPALLDPLVMAA